MAKQFVYMIGIEPQYWTTDDTNACKKYGVQNLGYYELGDNEGMILVGTLRQLMNVCEDYFGVEIVDEYLNEIDDFDYEDGRWITGGWFNLTESKKSLKESSKYDYNYFLQLLKEDKKFDAYQVIYDDDQGADNIHSVSDGTVHVLGNKKNRSVILPFDISTLWFTMSGIDFRYPKDSYDSHIAYDDIVDVNYHGDGFIAIYLNNDIHLTFEIF